MDPNEPYDINFCLPAKDLASDYVTLTPFVPAHHAEAFHTLSVKHPEMYRWVPMGPFPTVPAFLAWLDSDIRSDPTKLLFAVLAKHVDPDSHSKHLELAGAIGLLNTSPHNLSTEIGYVLTLPPWQGTHVTAHAIGLLLGWCLDDEGLGLRRVQWQANIANEPSWNAALRMGFRREMVRRWERALPPGKDTGEGVERREGDPRKEWGGRHTIMLSLCWDDWVEKKEAVRERMEKKAKRWREKKALN